MDEDAKYFPVLIAAYGLMKISPEKIKGKSNEMYEIEKEMGKEVEKDDFLKKAEAVEEMFGKGEETFYDLLRKMSSKERLEGMLDYGVKHLMIDEKAKEDILKEYDKIKK